MKDAILDLTHDQLDFRNAIEGFLRKDYGDDSRRAIIACDPGMSANIWHKMANELGLMGMGFSEAQGGYGGRALDQIPIMEAFGHALVVEPYLETVILAGRLLRHSDKAAAADLIASIIAGELRLAVTRADRDDISAAPHDGAGWRLRGRAAVVMATPWAHRLLVIARTTTQGRAVFLVATKAAGMTRRDYRTIDGRRAADIEFEDVVLDGDALLLSGEHAQTAIDEAQAHATVAICAEAVGLMRRLLAETSAHLDARKQFGAALAGFQVLQHQIADMLVAIELSAAQVFRAADALDSRDGDRALVISAAKAFVGRASHRVAQAAVQLHGGMGVTDELAIGQLFKRAVAIEAQFGSSETHVLRFQQLRAARAPVPHGGTARAREAGDKRE